MPQQYGEEDFNDILSSIMRGTTPPPAPQPVQRVAPNSQQAAQSPQPAPSRPLYDAYNHHNSAVLMTPHTPQAVPQKKTRKYKYKKKLLIAPVALAFVVAIGFTAKPIAALLLDASPFPAEFKSSANYPLLYPGVLPKGFSVDKASVSQSGEATIYAIKQGSDKAITISLQPQPSGLNLKPIFDTMKEVHKVEAPAGDTTMGIAPDNMLTSHTLAGSVWIIVRTPSGTISPQELEALIKSFKEA